MRKSSFYPVVITIFFAFSCSTSYKAENVQYSHYRIHQNANGNDHLSAIIKPYSDSVNKLMNVVIGHNESPLERKRQGNTLGYLMTDAYLEMARKKIDPKVDAAFMNSGGIRLPDLPAGPITQGKIYELMPFDNLMVVLKVKGSLLKQYLDTLAVTEGIVGSGMTVQIVNGSVQQVMIGGKSLDPNADYTIVHSDYVVMNSNLLKNSNRSTSNYLLRDAIIDYIRWNNGIDKKVTVSNRGRIGYDN
jgi:2',3'-cyclic-nucleotide 2'-phosphodiesterase (5'-nucleotidase family)